MPLRAEFCAGKRENERGQQEDHRGPPGADGCDPGENQGEKQEYTLLFAHAQDTLMTIYSEINIAK